MKIIVGLGNPGAKYENTRHNAGYMFLDYLANHKEIAPVGSQINFSQNDKFKASIAETNYEGEKLILVKPETYMNLSGLAVQKILQYYKAEPEDLIVVLDDIDLPLGTVRLRIDGSSAGQKGLQNIIDTLKTDNFLRIRIGIKPINGDSDYVINIPDKIDTANYVLSNFSDRQKKHIDAVMNKIVEYVLPHLGTKHEIPAHTLEVKIDSQ